MKHVKKTLMIALALVMILTIPAQLKAQQDADKPEISRYQVFRQLNDSEVSLDTLQIDELLTKWEADKPNEVELQSAKFQYLLKKALLEVEMPESPLTENTAMLPAIPGLYENLQITNYWILQDKGHAMEYYQKAYEILDYAIAQRPDRLDLLDWKMDGYMQKYEHRRGMLTALEMLQKNRQNHGHWKMLYDEPCESESLEALGYSCVLQLLEHNEVSLAEIMVDSLLSDNPHCAFYRLSAGLLMEVKMLPDSAIALYGEAYNAMPENTELLLRLSNCLINQGKTEDARPYIEVLASNPNEEVAAYGRQFLAAIEPVAWQYEAIEQWMQANEEELARLQRRFIAGDETLTKADLVHIYYGQAFTEGYSYFAFKGVTESFNDEDFEKCLKLCQKELETMPAALTTLYYGAFCAKQLNDMETFMNYMLRARQLSEMLGQLGDVNDINRAIPILWVAEEYTLLQNRGTMSSQSLIETEHGPVDKLTLVMEYSVPALGENDEIKVETKTSEQSYYFNISYPMGAMRKTMK